MGDAVPWAAVAAAAVGAVASRDSSRRASNTQRDAAREASNLERSQFDQTREDNRPMLGARNFALSQLMGGMGQYNPQGSTQRAPQLPQRDGRYTQGVGGMGRMYGPPRFAVQPQPYRDAPAMQPAASMQQPANPYAPDPYGAREPVMLSQLSRGGFRGVTVVD